VTSLAAFSRRRVLSVRHAASPAGLYVLVALVYGTFVISTVPGVRPHPGYNLFLDGFLNNIAYELSAVVCFVRARAALSYRRSWRWFGLGLAVYGAGNIYWTIFIRTQDPEPFPSFADALWLSFYPCAFIALLLIVREIAEDVPLSLWLDGVVGGLAVAGVAAAFFGPILAVTGGSPAAVVTTLAYPLLDVLLLLVVTALVALFSWRPPVSLWLLFGGLALFAVADAVYLFSATNGTYQPGGLGDAVWVAATLVIGFAPARSARASGIQLPDWVRLGFPVGATLCALAVLVYGGAVRRHDRDRAGAAHRHVPRGELAGRQPPARPDRRADRAGQPPLVLRQRAAAARGRQRPRRAAAAGPRPVQGGQRQPRAPRR
jgi:hypothetical protein